MKYVTAFFMAWGNFFAIPCPLKRWDSKYTSLMLGFLPAIGWLIGLVWALVYFLLMYLGFSFFAGAFIVALLPFVLSGFMHMDGFMDVCDAILSRRSLEERQRILKDSTTGAFAVVCAIFLILGYFCFLASALSSSVIDFANMILIVVLSRSVAGLMVLNCKPMKTSQYVAMQDAEPEVNDKENTDSQEDGNATELDYAHVTDEERTEMLDEIFGEKVADTDESSETETALTTTDPVPAEEPKSTKKQGTILLVALMLLIFVFEMFMSTNIARTLIVSLFTAAGALLAILGAKKNLGGMSGDIAGYGIMFGELIGVFALAIF